LTFLLDLKFYYWIVLGHREEINEEIINKGMNRVERDTHGRERATLESQVFGRGTH
jgi:hypothetical protein